MLTKDLLRHRLHDGRIVPQLLKATPAIVTLAQQLLDFWDAGVGRCLGELEDAALPILHGTRSLLVAKGLQKLVLDACTFRDAASCFALRELALAESARRLQQQPPADPAIHRAAVSAAIGQPLALLYGDLPDAAVLEHGSGLTVAKLLARYNLALAYRGLGRYRAAIPLFDEYLRSGAARGLSPHPLFDPAWVREGGGDLVWYLTEGWRQGASPHPLFDPAWRRVSGLDDGESEPLARFATMIARRVVR